MARPKKYSPKDIQELGEELCTFCEGKGVFHLVQFTREKGKTYNWWTKLYDSYPDLLPYHQRANEILGGKLVQLAFENGSPWAIQTFIPMYLKDVKKHLREESDHQIEMKEKAKRSGDEAVNEQAAELVGTMKEYIETHNEAGAKQ